MANKEFPLSVVIRAVDKITAPLRAITERLGGLAGPLQRIGGRFKVLGQSLKGLTDAAETVAKRVGIITGALAAAFYFIVKGTADAGDALSKLSQRAGVSVQSLSRLTYAGKLADLSQEDMAKTLLILNRNTVAAATGNKEMAKWFQRAGVSIKDANGKLKSTEQITLELADRFQKMPDGARKSAIAMGILGKSGAAAIPFLNAGANEIRRLGDEAERLGVTFTEDQAKAAEAFNDNLTRLMSAVEGLRNTIGNALIPVLDPLVQKLTGWIAANRQILSQKVAEWAQGLPEKLMAIANAISAIVQIGVKVAGALEWMANLIGWKATVGVLAAVIAGPLLSALVSVTAAFVSLGVAIMATPVGWIALAVAAVVAAFAVAATLIIKNWSTIKGWFTGFVEWLGKVFQSPIEAVRALFEGLFKGILWGISKITDGLGVVGRWFGRGGSASPSVVPQFQFGAPAVQPAAADAASGGLLRTTNDARVTVDFQNVPRGTQVRPEAGSSVPLDLNLGYAMGGAS